MDKMITVPQKWFEELIKVANAFKESGKKWEYGKSKINDSIFLDSARLQGYAESAKGIVELEEFRRKLKKSK